MMYRGYRISAVAFYSPHLDRVAWRAEWIAKEDHVMHRAGMVDSAEEALQLARDCVDYAYRVEVWQFLNGREYDAIKDGCIPENK